MDILDVIKLTGNGSLGIIILCYLHFVVTPSLKKTDSVIETIKENVNNLHIDINKTKHDCEKECMNINHELIKHITDKNAHK